LDHSAIEKEVFLVEYDTKGSRVITDPATNLARKGLSSQIGRDEEFSL
jgi:hypothetical protein